jgi:hypothetical protein
LGKRRAKRSRKVPDGPPLQKRSPASPASENGANRKSKSSQTQDKKSCPKTQDVERHFLWISHGQTTVGFVEQTGKSFVATSPDGRELGIFGDLKAAADATSAAYRGGA